MLAPRGRWLLADFLATGLIRYVRRLLRIKRFPERESLAAMLAPAGVFSSLDEPACGIGKAIMAYLRLGQL